MNDTQFVRMVGSPASRVLLFMITVMLVAACQREMRPEVHLIPKGYEGVVAIVYNDSSGARIDVPEGTIVYRIPETGVLRLKNEVNEGVIAPSEISYYYADDKGNITLIREERGEDVGPDSVMISHFKVSPGMISYVVSRKKRISEFARTRVEIRDSLLSRH